MNRKIKTIAGVIILNLLQIIAAAQGRQELSLNDAIELSIARSNLVKEYQEKLNSTEYSRILAEDNILPQISVQGSYTRLSNNITPYTINLPIEPGKVTFNPQILNQYYSRLNVSQVLFEGLKIRENINAATHKRNAVRYDIEKAKVEIAWQTVQAYYSVLKLSLTRKILESEKIRADTNLLLAKQFEKFGTATRNDVLRAELQVSNIDLSILQTNNQIKTSTLLLAINLGMDKDSIVMPDENVSPFSAFEESLDSYLETAIRKRAELKSVDENIFAAQSSMKIAGSAKYPKINVGGNLYYANPNIRLFPAQDKWQGTWDVGINLSYNITNVYTSNHSSKLARSERQMLQYKKLALADDIVKEVEAAYYDCVYSHEKIKVVAKASEQAAENYHVMNERYRNGNVLLNDLLEAQTLKIVSQINARHAQIDEALAFYKLLKSTGLYK